MARLLIDSEGTRRIYEILEDRLTVGRDPGNQVRLQLASARHLLLSRRAGSYVVEALDAAAGFRVNGARVEAHILAHGDRIQIGEATLVYLEGDRQPPMPKAAPASRPLLLQPPASDGPGSLADLADQAAVGLGVRARVERSSRRASRTPPAAKGRPLAIGSAVVFLVGAGIYLLLQIASSGGFGRSVDAAVNLAESQAARGAYQSALGTLGMARERGADPVELARIVALEESITRKVQRRADEPVLRHAAGVYQSMLKFEKVYLTKDPTARPASRELVRIADEWLASYREVCSRYQEYQTEIDGVESLRRAYVNAAQLGQPENLADVIFRAGSRVRLKNRRYSEALEILDTYRVGASAEDRAAIEVFRKNLLGNSAAWLERRVKRIGLMIRSGLLDDAERDLDFLDRKGLPAWRGRLETLRHQVDAAR